MTTMMGTPMASVIPAAMSTPLNMGMSGQQQQTLSEAHRRASVDHLDEMKPDKDLADMKQRSMSTPNTPKQSGLQLPPQAPMMPPGV
jgi:hypothetical protein